MFPPLRIKIYFQINIPPETVGASLQIIFTKWFRTQKKDTLDGTE
jgi:hypothetical protein